MKKITFLLSVLLIISCSATKSGGSASTKLSQRTLKGTWQVTDIRFVGEGGLYKANVFDLADSPCFKGSEWVFIPNNGTGKFTLSDANRCDGSAHRILWSFADQGNSTALFSFKFVDEKNKPLSGDKSGYRTSIEGLTASSFELRVNTSYEGKAFDVVMSLTKVSDEFSLY
jgi:hypothetical protein